MLDPVVGGEVAVEQGDQRGHGADACTTPSRRAELPKRLRSAAVATSVAPTVAEHAQVLEGQPRRRHPRRTSGSTAIASASFSGPRSPGIAAASPGASSGLRSEATSMLPVRGPRTAAAQCVGPWISSPLRSAIPPSRSFSES